MNYFLTEEQEMIKELASRIADEKIAPIAAEYDREGKFPHEIVEFWLNLTYVVFILKKSMAV